MFNQKCLTPRMGLAIENNKVQYVFIVIGDKIIFKLKNDFSYGFLICLSLYFIFDIEYPKVFRNIFSFIHEVLFDENLSLRKNTKYKQLMSEYFYKNYKIKYKIK
jgi:hypothetical protein